MLKDLSLKMAVVYAVLISVLLLITLHIAPRFSYTLDDPYIHLALAQDIAYGTYGINPGETTSPASSVFWPFLLVPFSHTAFRYWVPFAENLIFGFMFCALAGDYFGELLQKRLTGALQQWGMAFLLVLASNLAGLAFVGMEHTLQVLVCAGCGIAVVRGARGDRIGPVLLICAVLAPAVRYEDIVFAAAVSAVLMLQRRYLLSMSVFLASLVPLAALAVFLHGHGLPSLPNSVVAKSGVLTIRPHLFAQHPAIDRVLAAPLGNWRNLLTNPERIVMLPLVLALCVQVYKSRRDAACPFLLTGLAAVLLVLSFGPHGWFYRYEVALRLFLLVLVTASLDVWRSAAVQRTWLWLAPALLASIYMVAAVQTPMGSQAIASQQFQMHRLEHDYIRANVAVNDLGWVACDNDGQYYILDLLGLGSNDTLNVRDRTPAWLDAITRKHHIALAMVYGFGGVPRQWVLLGVLRHKHVFKDIVPAGVELYATNPKQASAMRAQVQAFARTLPPTAWLEDPPAQH